MLPAGSLEAPEDGQNNCPKHVELFGIMNKPLLLHLVGVYIFYGNVCLLLLTQLVLVLSFNSVHCP